MLEMAWRWRHRPGSALSLWFNERVAQTGGGFKKVMITALARKLVVALWKYVSAGVVIEGAIIATMTTSANSSSARADRKLCLLLTAQRSTQCGLSFWAGLTSGR
jgi:hypothetical protein